MLVHSSDVLYYVANSHLYPNLHNTNAITPSIGGIKNRMLIMHSIIRFFRNNLECLAIQANNSFSRLNGSKRIAIKHPLLAGLSDILLPVSTQF